MQKDVFSIFFYWWLIVPEMEEVQIIFMVIL